MALKHLQHVSRTFEHSFCLTDLPIDTQSKSTIVNIASAEETREVDDWFAETSEGKRYG